MLMMSRSIAIVSDETAPLTQGSGDMLMNIHSLPRTALAHLPTPLEFMPRLGERLGINLWIKRDDATGLALGGNKTRKLEFTVGQALAEGSDALVTCGGYQSNHVRQTAAAAARCGLAFHCALADPAPGRTPAYFQSGNLLLDRILNAAIEVAAPGETMDACAERIMDRLIAQGGKPFLVPLGASDAIGSVGYVAAAGELVSQCTQSGFLPSAVVLVTGSAGTHAGMLAGLRLLELPTQVIGVSSSEPSEAKREKVRAILGPLTERLGASIVIPDSDIEVLDDQVGEGYAIPTPAANAAIELAAATEGVILDPVYTGKGMAALIELARKGRFGRRDDVVFLHTGGSPALFVYEDQFWKGLPRPG
jgi:D-cysteine desulfhydrase family pyridoxal phosphate-dependent enzyme